MHCLGLRWDAADWEALGSSIGHFKWSAFLAVLEAKYCCEQLHAAALVEAVDEIYDVFIEDIIKKVDFCFVVSVAKFIFEPVSSLHLVGGLPTLRPVHGCYSKSF